MKDFVHRWILCVGRILCFGWSWVELGGWDGGCERWMRVVRVYGVVCLLVDWFIWEGRDVVGCLLIIRSGIGIGRIANSGLFCFLTLTLTLCTIS